MALRWDVLDVPPLPRIRQFNDNRGMGERQSGYFGSERQDQGDQVSLCGSRYWLDMGTADVRQNIGFLNNIKSVLGPNPLLWLCPQAMRGDGLSYPVNPEAGGESAESDWAGVAGRQGPLSAPESVERGVLNGFGEMLGSVGGSNGVQAGYGVGEERMRLSRGGGDRDGDSMV